MFARGTRPSVAVLALLAVAAALTAGATGGLPASAPTPQPNAWTVCPAPGKFITCLLATDAALWVGTEDQSVWRLDLKADPTQPAAWRQFATADTKTDNCYGLAQDAAGRIWVGTQNQGVSVYNGKEWKNYGVIDGPIGEHIFSIAADPDPKRGTVWIATDHGLTSWTPADVAQPPSAVQAPVDPFAAHGIADPNLAPGVWRSYIRGDGLPADQIYAVTVAPNGRVWIGTECDGLAWSDPPYKTWTSIRAAAERSGDGPGQNGRAAIGFQPGLPSNLTNGLLALPDGSIAYSTNYGLGLSRDGGRSWTAWQGVSNMAYENYLRGLAADSAGGLWIATRHKGLVRLDLRTGRATGVAKPALPDDYVFDVAITRDGSIWAGTYGGGLARMGPSVPGATGGLSASATGSASEYSTAVPGRGAVPDAITGGSSAPLSKPVPSDSAAAWKAYAEAISGKTKSATAPASTPAYSPALSNAEGPTEGPIPSGPPRKVAAPTPTAAKATPRDPSLPPLLPAPAAPPTLDQLNAMLALLGKVPCLDPEKPLPGDRLGDDWLTQGDWIGRHGKYWMVLSAIVSPHDYFCGSTENALGYIASLGPNCEQDDSLRYWIHWLYTGNVRSLELPPAYLDSRVQLGLTDWRSGRRQAEWDDHGEVYPMQRDGPSIFLQFEVPAGRYYLSLYFMNKDGHEAWNRWRDFTMSLRLGRLSQIGSEPSREDLQRFYALPEIGRARVRDFWSGVYKQFLVSGPAWYSIQIDRNHSFNTIVSSYMLDQVDDGIGQKVRGQGEKVPTQNDLNAAKNILYEEYTKNKSRFLARFEQGSTSEAAVNRLAQEVDRTFLRNPQWITMDKNRVYAPLARFYSDGLRGKSPLTEPYTAAGNLTKCYYELGLYLRWEEGLSLLGLGSPRLLEKAKRWDATKGEIKTVAPATITPKTWNEDGTSRTLRNP